MLFYIRKEYKANQEEQAFSGETKLAAFPHEFLHAYITC